MVLGRNVEQDRERVAYKNDNFAFLTLPLSPFVIFDSDNPLI